MNIIVKEIISDISSDHTRSFEIESPTSKIFVIADSTFGKWDYMVSINTHLGRMNLTGEEDELSDYAIEWLDKYLPAPDYKYLIMTMNIPKNMYDSREILYRYIFNNLMKQGCNRIPVNKYLVKNFEKIYSMKDKSLDEIRKLFLN